MENHERPLVGAAAEHARYPRNWGAPPGSDAHARYTGPCGDTMDFWLQEQDGRLVRVAFTTDGCASARACGSMTTCLATRMTRAEALALEPHDVLAALGSLPPEFEHCALLAVRTLREACRKLDEPGPAGFAGPQKGAEMRIAIPLAGGKLAMHFGHCERFALIDVDPETRTISKRSDLEPPPHEPGVLPRWLAQQGAGVIIAGGMGQRAQALFAQQKIEVILGACSEAPEELVAAYLRGTLTSGENLCDH